jgi:hypothetical protein
MGKQGNGQLPPVYVVFIILLVLFWAGFAVGAVNLVRGLIEEFPKFLASGRIQATMLDVYIENLFKKIVLVWILVHLQTLLTAVIRGQSFDGRNPKRIRRVGYGAFASALVGFLTDVYWSGWPKPNLIDFKNIFAGEIGRMIIFGVGLLIIAKVFETGLALKRDQDLTI